MPEPSGPVLVTIRTDAELRDAVKKRAAERGTTISELSRAYWKRYIR